MNKFFFCSLLVAGLVILGTLTAGCVKKEKKGAVTVKGVQKVEEVRPIRNAIEIKAEGEILHYQKVSLWNEKDFSEISESRKKFESTEIDSFKKNLSRYNKYAVSLKFEFNKERKSTTLICYVKGAMYGTNSYDFHWLLGDLPFDLYQFKQSEKELYYEGEINGVSTTIRLIFPYIIAHCHEHVWPAR